MKSLLLVMLGAALANNCVFQNYLGLAPVLGFSRCKYAAVRVGLVTMVVMLIGVLVGWPLINSLNAAGLGYLSVLASVAVILAEAWAMSFTVKEEDRGLFLFGAVNSAVLAAVLEPADSLAAALFTAIGTGFGFVLAMVVMAGLMKKIDMPRVPKAFRGLPAAILAAGIVSMALMAF